MPRPEQAFTLVEILVVLFIVSIMTGITVISLPSLTRTGDLDTEARRVKALLELAREDALLQANELGFKPEPDRYSFYRYDDVAQSWSELETRPFQPRELGEGISLRLEVEKGALKLGADDDDSEGAAGGKRMPPPVLLLSSGETTTFRLTVEKLAEGEAWVIEADGIGDLRWDVDEKAQ